MLINVGAIVIVVKNEYNFCMWYKAIPYLKWKVGVHATKASNEMVLVSMYGYF